MKTLPFFVSVLIALLLSACDKDSKNLLFENKGSNYSYEVYQQRGPLDNISFSETLFGFRMEGANTQRLVKQAMTEATPHKRVQFENFEDTLQHLVDFSGEWDQAAKKQFLEDLLGHYDLQLTKTTKKENFKEISVHDPEKLQNYLAKNQSAHLSINYKKDGRAFLKNARLENIHHVVQGNITYEGTNQKRYNFEWVRKSIEKNKGFFQKYGLALRDIKKPVLYYNLRRTNEKPNN